MIQIMSIVDSSTWYRLSDDKMQDSLPITIFYHILLAPPPSLLITPLTPQPSPLRPPAKPWFSAAVNGCSRPSTASFWYARSFTPQFDTNKQFFDSSWLYKSKESDVPVSIKPYPILVTKPCTGMTNPELSLKLLVDKSSKTVVYAEAGKDFVDFLFGLLELPLGSLMALINNLGRTAPSSFAKVYENVRNLDSSYFATINTKHSLLKPNLPSSNVNHTPLLQELAYTKPASYCSYYVNTPKKDVDGHVKGLVTYMVMDDLSLKSLFSTLTRSKMYPVLKRRLVTTSNPSVSSTNKF
ncbi:hypothetical protein RJ639_020975 [Escallonia herrerae]|uniref:Uncharacterized protein n=1 Tax=Escallonia herrerae TaxID=1293975 RepID=A0AA89AHX8_9ASTE|nr:hypothetical protein RJ639_020975 [Escallonia herrerae]